VQALNTYTGAVVIVSHDRHMIELVADRLVLVDSGRAQEYGGSLEDYTDFVLGKASRPESGASKADRKADKRAAAEARERYKALQMEVKRTEKILADLMATRSRVDAALFDPASAGPQEKGLTMTQLMKRRAELEDAIEAAELSWVEANEALELTEA
jgi:ATP-binding cassette subfamily F protein 3